MAPSIRVRARPDLCLSTSLSIHRARGTWLARLRLVVPGINLNPVAEVLQLAVLGAVRACTCCTCLSVDLVAGEPWRTYMAHVHMVYSALARPPASRPGPREAAGKEPAMTRRKVSYRGRLREGSSAMATAGAKARGARGLAPRISRRAAKQRPRGSVRG